MWFALPAAVAVVLIIAGFIAGGPVTIVLLPLAVVVVLVAFVFNLWSRSQNSQGGRSQRAQTGDPLPHGAHSNTPSSPTTPDELVNARRPQQ
jgi:type III secretory pathway component EscV